MPEGKGAYGPSGPINQQSPRSGVSLGNGRGSGPGLTSSSAFGSVAQGPAGRVGCRRTRGPWNTVGPQGQGYAAKAPWAGADRSVRRRTRPDRRVAVRPQTIAIRKNRQAACRLARTPCLVCPATVRRSARPNPADAPQRSSPARAAHKGQGDHDPRWTRRLGETRHTPLDQEGQDRRVRGADQLVWASLERGDTTPKAAGQGPSTEGLPPRPHGLPRGYFQKDEID